NKRDLERADDWKLAPAQRDRLTLTSDRIRSAAAGLREVAALPDPVGRLLHRTVRPNGLEIRKVSVPLGVILFIYESPPNVTVDAAALCVKSGNAVILRGGTEALESNRALCRIVQETLVESELPSDAVQLVDTADREAVGQLLKLDRYIDLVI